MKTLKEIMNTPVSELTGAEIVENYNALAALDANDLSIASQLRFDELRICILESMKHMEQLIKDKDPLIEELFKDDEPKLTFEIELPEIDVDEEMNKILTKLFN